MTTQHTASRRVPWLLALVALGIGALMFWAATSSSDKPLSGAFSATAYESIEELAGDADLIIEGTVSDVLGRELDYGTANVAEREGETGVPFVYYEVKVTETHKGDSADAIVVGNVDGEKFLSSNITPLKPGESVVLFLIEQDRKVESPGLTMFDTYYTTLSLNAGIFDVLEDSRVAARGYTMREAVGSDMTTDDLAELVMQRP